MLACLVPLLLSPDVFPLPLLLSSMCSINFYKDGYTDSRGRFDYASLSTSKLPNVERFSILILTESHGAVVREAAPPSS